MLNTNIWTIRTKPNSGIISYTLREAISTVKTVQYGEFKSKSDPSLKYYNEFATGIRDFVPKIHWNAFYAKWEMFTFQISSTHSGLFQCSVFFQMCCPWTSSAGPGKENTKLCEKWSILSPTCLYIKINLNYGKFLGKPFNYFFSTTIGEHLFSLTWSSAVLLQNSS